MYTEEKGKELLAKLEKHPKLFLRVEELVKVVENTEGDLKKASEAEMRVIEEVRQMGNEALQSWAKVRVEKVSEEARKAEGVRRAGKKTALA